MWQPKGLEPSGFKGKNNHLSEPGDKMITPWGELASLNLKNHELAATILSADKHQLIEGLVVECLFDQIVDNVSSLGRNVIALDVDSVVVDTRRIHERWIVFVWARTKGDGLGRYLQALGRCAVPYLVEYENGEFFAVRMNGRKRVGEPRILCEVMHELSQGRVTPFIVNDSVKNHNRQRRAFWGFMSDYYQDKLGEKIVLPRILINCAIQPYFRAVWNLDRIFVVENEIWIFEIKHKFPIDKKPLLFGINDGELGMLEMLTHAGIRCLHTILVKPYWSKDVGSMYLLNDLNMRTRAAVIATVLDQATTAHIMGQQSGRSGAHTSINGVSGLKYKSIPSSNFSPLGVLSDPPLEVAAKMASLISGQKIPSVNDNWLRELRAKNIEHNAS